MLICLFGTPSALTYWFNSALSAILHAAHGDAHVVAACSVADLERGWTQRGERSTILFTDCPQQELSALMLSSNSSLIAIADDPEDLAGYVVNSRKMEVQYAVRFGSQCYATLADAIYDPRTKRFGVQTYGRPVRDVIFDLSEVLTLDFDTAAVQRVLENFLLPAGLNSESTVLDHILRIFDAARPPGLYFDADHEARDYVRRVLAQYAPIPSGNLLDKLDWPREAFSDWDRNAAFLHRTIDLVGPARFIICGPYLHLPRGAWSADVEVEVSDNDSGNRLRSDIFHGDVRAGITTDLPQRGIFSFQLSFEVSEPTLPVEVRFELLRGAIEGKFLLRSVRLQRDLAMSKTNGLANRLSLAAI